MQMKRLINLGYIVISWLSAFSPQLPTWTHTGNIANSKLEIIFVTLKKYSEKMLFSTHGVLYIRFGRRSTRLMSQEL